MLEESAADTRTTPCVCWESTSACMNTEFPACILHVKLQIPIIRHIHALSEHLCMEKKKKGEINGDV